MVMLNSKVRKQDENSIFVWYAQTLVLYVFHVSMTTSTLYTFFRIAQAKFEGGYHAKISINFCFKKKQCVISVHV